MRVLVCGSRDWDDGEEHNLISCVLTGLYSESTVGHLVAEMSDFVVIEGAARGADEAAAWWARQSPMHSHNEREDDPVFEHLAFKADWRAHGKAAGRIRNKRMLEEGQPDIVLAFKNAFQWDFSQGGTEDMVKQAKAAGIPAYVIGRA